MNQFLLYNNYCTEIQILKRDGGLKQRDRGDNEIGEKNIHIIKYKQLGDRIKKKKNKKRYLIMQN